ncbi:MAG: hypothetical protein IAE80_24755 [Anaerolinea sp.]|nr:hypothetical protein [Anaerolinea sp.]
MRYYDRYRNFSRSSRAVFWIILAAMVLVGLCAFFTSEAGRTVSLVCCGGLILLVVVGILSERGMKRPQ